MADGDLVGAGDEGVCPDPFAVFAADGEAFDFGGVDGAEGAAEGVEGDGDFGAFDGDGLELGAAIRDLDAVVLGEGEAGEALGDVAFVFGVDVIGFAEIDDDRLAAVFDGLLGFGLAFAEFGPGAVAGGGDFGFEVGELDPVKGEVFLFPLLAPMGDHEGEEMGVFGGAIGIGFALIPDGTFDAVADDGEEDTVVEVAGAMLAGEDLLRALGSADGEGFASGFGFGGFGFPVGEGGVVFGFGFGGGEVFFFDDPAVHEGFEMGVGFEEVTADPGFGSAAAPGVVDESDGDVEHLMEDAAVEEADGAEVADSCWGAGLPGAFEVGLGFLGADLRDGDEADVGEFCGGDFEVGVPGGADGPLHVGLAGAEPDFADEDVGEVAGGGALDGDFGGLGAGGDGVKGDGPFAIGTGFGSLGLAGEGDCHIGAWGIPAPDGVGVLLLEHHVVANDGGELEFGLRGEGEAKDEGGEEVAFHGWERVDYWPASFLAWAWLSGESLERGKAWRVPSAVLRTTSAPCMPSKEAWMALPSVLVQERTPPAAGAGAAVVAVGAAPASKLAPSWIQDLRRVTSAGVRRFLPLGGMTSSSSSGRVTV